jgi:hypothetical protein
MAPADLDSPGSLSCVPEDFHSAARLVAAVRTLQPPLPARRVGVAAEGGRQLGTICSRRRRRVSVARSVHRAAMGRTLGASGSRAGGETLAGYRLERLDSTHHPCLGLDCDPPYSAVGGDCLSAPTRSPLAGSDRAHADRLRTRRLPARLADAVGLPVLGPASSRVGHRRRVRRFRAPYRLSVAGNLYGRSISPSAPPHRFLPGAKGGSFAWEQAPAIRK